MALTEFELIRAYFAHVGADRGDVLLGVGDDCALLRVPEGRELAVTIDTLVEGVHFLPGVNPESLGHKALAVNLSDLAAMGAEPAWVTLALTLPETDSEWLRAFSRGFSSLAERHNVRLVGGDITCGPLAISVQAQGFVGPGRSLRRDGAHVGDRIYVTGTLGDAGLALLAQQGRYDPKGYEEALAARLHTPTPRIEAGRLLTGIAHSAVDISDGLVADLGHICEMSGVGAKIYIEEIPLSPAVQAYREEGGGWDVVLYAGDDYELCFTLPPRKEALLERLREQFKCPVTAIGDIVADSGVHCLEPDGNELSRIPSGYRHF